MMATYRANQNVKVEGDDPALLASLSEPLRAALAKRTALYSVRIAAIGHVGEVLVSVDGKNGHVPLLFRTEELEAGYVCSVVLDTVQRYDI
jgi:hypothetical protein